MRAGVKIAAGMSVTVLALTGCGSPTHSPGSESGFPGTVENCGREVQIDHRPERVVALGPSEVTTIASAGGSSKLVGRDDAGLKSAPYPPELRAEVAAVPQLGSGGEITRENLIALKPDLVVGSVSETITPDTLAAVGIPMISLRGNCGSNHAPGVSDGTSDFDDVAADLQLLGRLLGTSDRAAASMTSLRQQLRQATVTAPGHGTTAAAVIVFKSGLEGYGRRSMIHTQFQQLGLTDVFADADSRVFEASIEQLIARNPQLLVILSYGETDEQAKVEFLRIPGAADLAAVRNNALIVHPYEYSSQGALSVLGLENIAHYLTSRK